MMRRHNSPPSKFFPKTKCLRQDILFAIDFPIHFTPVSCLHDPPNGARNLSPTRKANTKAVSIQSVLNMRVDFMNVRLPIRMHIACTAALREHSFSLIHSMHSMATGKVIRGAGIDDRVDNPSREGCNEKKSRRSRRGVAHLPLLRDPRGLGSMTSEMGRSPIGGVQVK